jgi:RNA polymerase sigma-70 factor (ECF subfamily)
MTQEAQNEVTRLLLKLTDARAAPAAVEELLPLIYDELRVLAGKYLRRERANHTLQPTALVHEAYLKLIDQREVEWQNRAHFFGVAANVMRRILVDYARRTKADKRGGKDAERVELDDGIMVVSKEKSVELLALDEALEELAKIDAQKSKIVELRYFGGLSVEETAEVLGVAAITVKRQWRMAKAWLYGKIKDEGV